MNEWMFQESHLMPSVEYQRNIKYLYFLASKHGTDEHKKKKP